VESTKKLGLISGGRKTEKKNVGTPKKRENNLEGRGAGTATLKTHDKKEKKKKGEGGTFSVHCLEVLYGSPKQGKKSQDKPKRANAAARMGRRRHYGGAGQDDTSVIKNPRHATGANRKMNEKSKKSKKTHKTGGGKIGETAEGFKVRRME